VQAVTKPHVSGGTPQDIVNLTVSNKLYAAYVKYNTVNTTLICYQRFLLCKVLNCVSDCSNRVQ